MNYTKLAQAGITAALSLLIPYLPAAVSVNFAASAAIAQTITDEGTLYEPQLWLVALFRSLPGSGLAKAA